MGITDNVARQNYRNHYHWVFRKKELELNTWARDVRHLPTLIKTRDPNYEIVPDVWHYRKMLKLAALKALLTEVGRLWGDRYSWLRVWLVMLGPEAPHHLSYPPYIWGKPRCTAPPSGKNRESQEKVFSTCFPPLSGYWAPSFPRFPSLYWKSRQVEVTPEPKQQRAEWADPVSTVLPRLILELHGLGGRLPLPQFLTSWGIKG